MSIEVAVQTVTLVLAVLAIVWHQQRTTEKLRDDFTHANEKLRDEVVANGQQTAKLRDEVVANGQQTAKLRDEVVANGQQTATLRDEVVANGQRLARIEGFLGVGMPQEVAEQAAGAAVLSAD